MKHVAWVVTANSGITLPEEADEALTLWLRGSKLKWVYAYGIESDFEFALDPFVPFGGPEPKVYELDGELTEEPDDEDPLSEERELFGWGYRKLDQILAVVGL